MARIYVSSTFNDLKEFREHVRLQLRQMGHEDKSLIATAVHNWENKDGVIPQKKEAEELDIGSYQKAIESESASVNQISDIPKIKTQEEVHREKIKVCESLNK